MDPRRGLKREPMIDDYPPELGDATPDEILAIIQDQHRQQCQHDPEADSAIALSRDSTVAKWRRACDLIPWKPLARAMNDAFRADIPLAAWRAVLDPPDQHTLGEVCDLLARHAKVPRARPVRVLGRECLPAGVFLTVRSCLAAAGADVSRVAPSTELAEYTRRYPGVFLGPVSLLAPGALPPVRIRTPVRDAFVLGVALAHVALLVSFLFALVLRTHVPFTMVFLTLTLYLCLGWTIRFVPPERIEFPGLRTFRDLSLAIAVAPRHP